MHWSIDSGETWVGQGRSGLQAGTYTQNHEHGRRWREDEIESSAGETHAEEYDASGAGFSHGNDVGHETERTETEGWYLPGIAGETSKASWRKYVLHTDYGWSEYDTNHPQGDSYWSWSRTRNVTDIIIPAEGPPAGSYDTFHTSFHHSDLNGDTFNSNSTHTDLFENEDPPTLPPNPPASLAERDAPGAPAQLGAGQPPPPAGVESLNFTVEDPLGFSELDPDPLGFSELFSSSQAVVPRPAKPEDPPLRAFSSRAGNKRVNKFAEQTVKQRFVRKIEQEFVSGFLVHNLTIDEDHTFAVGADAVLVHNTGGCDPKLVAQIKAARGHGNNIIVKTQKEAEAILEAAKPGIPYLPTYGKPKPKYGVEVHPPDGAAVDLPHLKWRDWREGKSGADGHIFFERPS